MATLIALGPNRIVGPGHAESCPPAVPTPELTGRSGGTTFAVSGPLGVKPPTGGRAFLARTRQLTSQALEGICHAQLHAQPHVDRQVDRSFWGPPRRDRRPRRRPPGRRAHHERPR